jgi:hypothetical protein
MTGKGPVVDDMEEGQVVDGGVVEEGCIVLNA